MLSQELANAFSLVIRHDWPGAETVGDGSPLGFREGGTYEGEGGWRTDVELLVKQGQLTAQLLQWCWEPLGLDSDAYQACALCSPPSGSCGVLWRE